MQASMESPDPVHQAPHFLFVTSALHGHINPARRLAASVAAANPAARVTFSTSIFGHRLMFPTFPLACPDEEVVTDDDVLHAPYSDGYDDGYDPAVHDACTYAARARDVGCETLSRVVARLAARGRPVTRVVYTFFVGWALDVARAHGVPAAVYWIQPATVFAVYHRCFHGHGEALLAPCASTEGPRDASVQLPGLPALKPNALPSILKATSPEHPMHMVLLEFRNLFEAINEHRPKVLVNTFEALEPDALRAVPQLEMVAVGPAVPPPSRMDLPRRDGAKDYLGWLDTKPARSVVYVSFGSLVPMSKRQEEEMARGLEAAGWPYLWARKGAELDGANTDADLDGGKEQGMVVDWCDQVRVLSHRAVGCFVTHCGWNSVLESMVCGVPIVAVPQWTDQPTVAWLVEERAGVGVRAQVVADEQGVVECVELLRCVETVMGGGRGVVDIRTSVDRWRELAREAIAAGGSSEKNLRAFASGL